MEAVGFGVMAGSAGLAACMAEIITLPIDTAKVRMQVVKASSAISPGAQTSVPSGLQGGVVRNPSFLSVLYRMGRQEGLSSWWKGLPAGLHRQFVYASLRMAMYPHIRDRLNAQQGIIGMLPDLGRQILAGMSSGAIGMTIANPTDVVKVRLQSAITRGAVKQPMPVTEVAGQAAEAATSSFAQPKYTVYRGAMHAYATIIKEEGVLGLWRGLGPNIIRNAIVCAAELVAYDELKKIGRGFLPDGLTCHCFAGFGAGFIATIVGSPVDVVKTRYMNARPGQYRNLTHCIVGLAKEAGPRGFYKGFVPNVVRLGTFNMLVFVFYEQILNFLKSDKKSTTQQKS